MAKRKPLRLGDKEIERRINRTGGSFSQHRMLIQNHNINRK